jgi:hypothetical protein
MEDTRGACSSTAGASSAKAGCTANCRTAANGSTRYAPGSGTSSANTNRAPGATGGTKARSLAKAAETPCAGH